MLWDEFNIKVFPAETLVFRDGLYAPDLSDHGDNIKFDGKDIIITGAAELPYHIIYIGEIAGIFDIKCKISSPDTQVFLTARLYAKKPVEINFYIENAGKFSDFEGKVFVFNKTRLKVNIFANHSCEKTGVFVENRVLAGPGSQTDIGGTARIERGCHDCRSDLKFSARAAENAKVKFRPMQRIGATPENAEHSANIWRGTAAQIDYLRTNGLGKAEIEAILDEAFEGI